VVNEGTWETGDNRSYTFTSTEPQSVPIAYFDRVNNLGPLSIHATPGSGVTLSWTAAPRVRLESTGDLVQGPWTTVPNTEGQGSASVDIGPARQFFRLSGP
jgi:hypothetical protein